LTFEAKQRGLLSQWPLPRPADWLDQVNTPETAEELEAVRVSVKRGRPYGQDAWQRQTARLLGLEATFRPQGRPPKRSVPTVAGAEVDVHDENES
jgi:putative transposase